jgi:hypothetical protein
MKAFQYIIIFALLNFQQRTYKIVEVIPNCKCICTCVITIKDNTGSKFEFLYIPSNSGLAAPPVGATIKLLKDSSFIYKGKIYTPCGSFGY